MVMLSGSFYTSLCSLYFICCVNTLVCSGHFIRVSFRVASTISQVMVHTFSEGYGENWNRRDYFLNPKMFVTQTVNQLCITQLHYCFLKCLYLKTNYGGSCKFSLDFMPLDYFNHATTSCSYWIERAWFSFLLMAVSTESRGALPGAALTS